MICQEFTTDYGDDDGPDIPEQLAKMAKNVWVKKKGTRETERDQ